MISLFMSIKTNLTILGLLSLLSYIAARLFMFFGVSPSVYFIYLVYGYVLGFWNMLLPVDPVDLFSIEKKEEK